MDRKKHHNYLGYYFLEYETAQKEYEKVEEEKHALHKQIMEIGGSKLKTAESKLIMVNNQMDTITGRITKATVGVKTAKRYYLLWFYLFCWLIYLKNL